MNQKDNDKIEITPEAKEIITEQIKRMLGPDADPDAVQRAVDDSIKKIPSQSELKRMEQDLVKRHPGLARFLKPRSGP